MHHITLLSILNYLRLASLFAELCLAYYKEEGRRIRSIIEKKSSPFPELNIRYCFKVTLSLSISLRFGLSFCLY
jgi:trafficking protein particle complex subunit 11